MLLYKYCDAGGVEILRWASIVLKRPRAFNDPFDLNPYISKFDDAALMGDYVFNKLRDIVVLSLTENCDSLLMWAHYADQHQGFLIGFDGGARIIEDGLINRIGVRAVSYGHHRPSAERMKQLTDDEVYFRKSSDWAHERDWRIITSIVSMSENVPNADQQDRWPFPLVTKDVRTIIVGHRAAAIFPELTDILSEDRYKQVSLRLAVPDIERYKLNLKRVPRSKWHTTPEALLGQAQS